MKTSRIGRGLSALGVALALSIGTASAGVVLYQPITQINDQNLDFVFDTGTGNTGTIGVGDRLFSIFQFSQTVGLPSGGPSPLGADSGNAGTTLTGIADVTVVAVLPDGTLVFAPTDQTGSEGVLGGLGFTGGTAIAVYLNSTLDTVSGVNDILNSNCGTRANCTSLATDGSVYLTAGFFGDPDESWTSLPIGQGGTISAVQNGNAQSTFGIFNFNLSVGINNTGAQLAEAVQCAPTCGPGGNGLVQVSGNGQINGGQGLTPSEWTARSKTGAQIAPVPEPASVALVGLGLLGLAGIRMRRKS